MNRRRSSAPALLALAIAAPALAGSGTEVNGYFGARTTFTRANATGYLPTKDLAQLGGLAEANGQLKHSYAERGFVYGDLSLFGQLATDYRGADADGKEVVVADHDVAATHPLVSLSELYLSHDVRPELNLLVGKKRVVWGSGMAFNPTDLLNPPKDPTDPTFQRAGVYMARVEVPLETLTFTVLASPGVLKQESGIPYRFFTWPDWDAKDYQTHYQLAARAYALVENADVNLMAFYGNHYNDAFENKFRFGASFSRYFFTDYELHFEGLFQSGSVRQYPVTSCLADSLAALGCVTQKKPFFDRTRQDDLTILPRVLVGTRYQFSDESLLSAEYLYQADGYEGSELQSYVDALSLLKQARSFGFDGSSFLRGSQDPGLPQKLAFEPLAKHYLFLSYQKPKIRDDFTFMATVIANAQDFSSIVTASLSWSVTEALTLTLQGFVPLPGLDALAATDPETGAKVTEYSAAPMLYRGLFEARIFY